MFRVSQTRPMYKFRTSNTFSHHWKFRMYWAKNSASLVQESVESVFRVVEDLKSCRVPPADICLPRGGAAATFWRNAIAPQYVHSPVQWLQFGCAIYAWDAYLTALFSSTQYYIQNRRCHNEAGAGKPTFVDGYEEGNSKVASKQCKFFLASGATTQDAANGRYCGDVTTTGQSFFRGGVSFILPRNSNLTLSFSEETMDLRIEDALDTLPIFFAKRGMCSKQSHISLTARRLRIFFFMAYGAVLVMFLLMVGDPNVTRREHNSRPEDSNIEKKAEEDEMSTSEESTDCYVSVKDDFHGV